MNNDNDIFGDIFEEDTNENTISEGTMVCEISADRSRANIIANSKKIKPLTGETRTFALHLAEERLEETKIKFCEFQNFMTENETAYFLISAIQLFSEYAYEMLEFIKNIDSITEEDFDNSILSEYMIFEATKIIAEQFLIDCYDSYLTEQAALNFPIEPEEDDNNDPEI